MRTTRWIMITALVTLIITMAAHASAEEFRSYYSGTSPTSQQAIAGNYSAPPDGTYYYVGDVKYTWSADQNRWVCTLPATTGGGIVDGVYYSSDEAMPRATNVDAYASDSTAVFGASQVLDSPLAYAYEQPYTTPVSGYADPGMQLAFDVSSAATPAIQPLTAPSTVLASTAASTQSSGGYWSGSVWVPDGASLSATNSQCDSLPSAFTFTMNGVPVTVTNAAYSKNGVSQIYSPANGTQLPYYSYLNGTGVQQYPGTSGSAGTCPTSGYSSCSNPYSCPNYSTCQGYTNCAYNPSCSTTSGCVNYQTTPSYPTYPTNPGGNTGNNGQVVPPASQTGTMEQASLALLNSERVANGLSPLPMDSTLQYVAQVKSQDMAANNYFAHESPTYGRATDMLNSIGYQYTSAAENIAHHEDVYTANAAFMSSAGHRANILGSSWTKVGVGVALDKNGYPLITQIFAR